MKLSKPAIKAHEQAVQLLAKDSLTYDEKLYVFENWTPMYSNQVNKAGIFFTPVGLACDFCIEVVGDTIIDLCAGIGMLAFTYYHWCNEKPNFTCIEINPEFVAVGKKLLPEANWICASAVDIDLLKSLGKFDCAISNPPFGKISKEKHPGELYHGSEFEYKVISAAKEIAKHGRFIIPQMSCPFAYSGQREMKKQSSEKHNKFISETGIILEPNCGIDTDIYKTSWNGASPSVEIVCVDYSNDANDLQF